ncbi:peptidase U32 [Deinococcus proteolyticus MRP]|uniref:Peptidase U32 n=1 Tax=Deinococcus proteolyticus (strain ATCC 35074 / DSM 20540 / JCM 6276 / NBRC 101906 / NCIMB 13154 / VKM Ac-1939 / CCM 2703 / MRP) TaxID=693977 RepID=F0RK09_DEIPM|nr:peptidase U32 [Deinococcus proteolyticus MRP]
MPTPAAVPTPLTRKPEVMAPAGGRAQIRAAIEAGADAVFFGVNPPEAEARQGGAGFHARAKVGIASEELPEVMRELHARGVLGFVTFNILVFDRELRRAERSLMALAEAGVDAIIVQDHGVARLAHDICPDLHIHGSTQMSITSAEGAELARRFGANRVVLGRELSLADIERIRRQTDMELETFVHGALCVSYSGQCFSSEAWGGRSANRGQCAQACRLPYDMFVDGEYRDLGDARYLLSPGDLYTLHQVPELVRIGVDCLKIEGRYKDAEFVALTTAAYRKAVDEAWAGLPLSVTPQEEQDLEQIYSRGLGPHFMTGTNHQAVVRGRAPRHRGVQVGTVRGVTERGVLVELERAVKPGDGLVFDPANWRKPEGREEGGFVYGLWQGGVQVEAGNVRPGQVYELRFGRGAVDPGRVRAGDPVWRTQDPTLNSRLKPLTDAADPVYTRPVAAQFVGRLGEVPALTLTDEEGRSVTVQGDTPLGEARSRALDAAALREQLGKLGGTGYHLGDFRAELTAPEGVGLFLPLGALNALRRAAVSALTELRGRAPERQVVPQLDGALQASVQSSRVPTAETPAPQLHVLVRTPEQLDAALAERPDSITLDYLELYGLKPSVERVRAAGIPVRVASPRILKPTEQNLQKFLLSLNADILVRSGGLLEGLQAALPSLAGEASHRGRGVDLTGDFSLNAANVLTTRALLDLGLSRMTPTHDLNAQQVAELAGLAGPETLEAIAYQHLPVFHTEHCVFCRFLSDGTNYTNCGHPCESHRVALRDERGVQHPVMADVGCRNTVFEGRPQVAGMHLDDWQAAGIRHFRLEFVHETPEQVRAVIARHREYLAGQLSSAELEEALEESGDQGVTEGSLFVPRDFGLLDELPMV